ncbi:unnamed protein product [Brassica oleracea var. botrytis]|uniref:(rape) hypothetical protein n=1 Tax=Brassica napus TaxID=3708 RepID=A0A078H3A9_BRANA|nr:unnamed protein product [Brassica napus]CDY33100.1 BnaC09g21960D [Brassica napus]
MLGETTVPPSLDPQNGVFSKDSVYSPEKNLSIRIYFHGGGFVVETAFSPTLSHFPHFNRRRRKLLSGFPIPIPYEDSWDALNAGGNMTHHLALRALS